MKNSRRMQAVKQDHVTSPALRNAIETPSPAMKAESAASYIADITTELAGIARASQLEILAYLLDIAQLEAANTSRKLARDSIAG